MRAKRKFTFRFTTPIAAGVQIRSVTARTGHEAETALRETYAGARCITLIKAERKKWIDTETLEIISDSTVYDL